VIESYALRSQPPSEVRCALQMAEIFLVGGRGNQRIAMSSDLIRDR
jgi:hypothetical protein